jgi:hypothetical protein
MHRLVLTPFGNRRIDRHNIKHSGSKVRSKTSSNCLHTFLLYIRSGDQYTQRPYSRVCLPTCLYFCGLFSLIYLRNLSCTHTRTTQLGGLYQSSSSEQFRSKDAFSERLTIHTKYICIWRPLSVVVQCIVFAPGAVSSY